MTTEFVTVNRTNGTTFRHPVRKSVRISNAVHCGFFTRDGRPAIVSYRAGVGFFVREARV